MADRFPLIIDNSEEKIKELVSGDNLDLTKSNLKNADHIQSAGVNVAGVATATSLIGDGSQLTNLPPSGGSLEATASGTLADGSTVIVNTDGTVSVVAQTETTGPGTGSATVFKASSATYWISTIYDSTNNKVIIVYRDGVNSGAGTAIVGTVSGTSISFGSEVVFNSGDTREISSVYDPDTQKIVIAYKDEGNSGVGTAVVGTVSGTSISFGSSAVFQSGVIAYISATFDSSNNKVVIAYQGNSYHGTAIVGTVSGTSISFGSSAVYNSATTGYIGSAYAGSGKVVITYQNDGDSAKGYVSVGTVSGTSISFGTAVKFEDARTSYTSPTYDSTNGKVVIAYQDEGNSLYGTAIVGTVSGTSISFGSAVVFESAESSRISATYDSSNQKVVIAYRDHGNSSYGTLAVGTVSGTSISFGSPIIFNSNGSTSYISTVYDSANQKVVIAYTDNGNNSYGTAVVFGNTGVSPVPEIGSPAVYNSNGSPYNSAVYDSTNNKVVIAYRDNGNSQYGTAIVGTVSGTSITFGTPVVFSSTGTDYISATFDSSNGVVVIAYEASYGRAIVGTVSGTSISFGSSNIFESGSAVTIGSTFDSTNNKVVITWVDTSSSNDYGKAVVGTVSGTSISFGSTNTFHSTYTSWTSPTFDSTNGKVVVAYQDSANSNRGTAIVGTVSGTSISFGPEAVFETGITARISSVYDSANGKVVIAYYDQSNSYYGTAVVGTVSGTSISFGTPVVFNSASTSHNSIAYDSTNQKVVIAYRDQGNSNYGTAVVGTVSGTSISFGSPTIFESASTNFISAAFDSTNNKVVIAYMDSGNSSYGTAVTFSPRTISSNLTSENYIGISDGAYTNGQTATIQIMGAVDDAQSSLTPGQAYYVQNDGTLSTSADSPSVFAGTAIAATKLIVRG